MRVRAFLGPAPLKSSQQTTSVPSPVVPPSVLWRLDTGWEKGTLTSAPLLSLPCSVPQAGGSQAKGRRWAAVWGGAAEVLALDSVLAKPVRITCQRLQDQSVDPDLMVGDHYRDGKRTPKTPLQQCNKGGILGSKRYSI